MSAEVLIDLVDRMKTFGSGWKSPVDPAEMVICGMYYLQVRDVTRCSHCLNVQSDWSPHLPVIVQHASKFPQCRIIGQILNPLTVFYSGQQPGVVAQLQALLCTTKDGG